MIFSKKVVTALLLALFTISSLGSHAQAIGDAKNGKKLFKSNCGACHKLDKRFIGPSPVGIMERRAPEWIMNMILDPSLMTAEDRCAKDLLIEFNGAAMANQNLTVEQTRSILEYFRTL